MREFVGQVRDVGAQGIDALAVAEDRVDARHHALDRRQRRRGLADHRPAPRLGQHVQPPLRRDQRVVNVLGELLVHDAGGVADQLVGARRHPRRHVHQRRRRRAHDRVAVLEIRLLIVAGREVHEPRPEKVRRPHRRARVHPRLHVRRQLQHHLDPAHALQLHTLHPALLDPRHHYRIALLQAAHVAEHHVRLDPRALDRAPREPEQPHGEYREPHQHQRADADLLLIGEVH